MVYFFLILQNGMVIYTGLYPKSCYTEYIFKCKNFHSLFQNNLSLVKTQLSLCEMQGSPGKIRWCDDYWLRAGALD